jgi:hypothetical protein
MPTQDSQESAASVNETPQQTPGQAALSAWITKRYEVLRRNRWAEELKWYEAGLFDQQKQWLEKDGQDGRKLKPIKVNENTTMPMPVSNYFSDTISINSNSLGAALPRMLAEADNQDNKNLRAAQAARNAIDAANEESQMNVLNPILAKQVPLWGLGITKDSVAFDHSTDEVPDIQTPPPTIGPDGQPVEQEPQVVGTEQVPSARLKTELPTVFEVYLPRECQDANTSELIIERRRVEVGLAKELYPAYADQFKGEAESTESNESLAAFFHASLRSLQYTSNVDEESNKIKLIECWCDWNVLSSDVQDAIKGEWSNEPSSVYPSMTKLGAVVQFGLFAVMCKNDLVEWGENPWDGDVPYTFFPWQKDVASPYPKGLSVALLPLQKQVNKLDSLMMRGLMANSTPKLVMPNTQKGKPPTGDPVDIYIYDPTVVGNSKPEYFGGHAYGSEIIQKREQLVNEFKTFGYTNEVSQGEMPGSGTAFRALAFLGSKAEESRKTQRYLWEQAHEIRARKIVKMARKVWSEPRKIRTAGFNNRYGARLLEAADLEGAYQLKVEQDSSVPKTQTEKLAVFQELVAAGTVDPTSVANRVLLTNWLGIPEVDLADNLDYAKAERDLELCKTGVKPQSNPYSNWAIHFLVFSQYTKTEEYEESQPEIQASILGYTQWLQEMMQPPSVPGGPPPTPGLPAHQQGLPGQKPPHPGMQHPPSPTSKAGKAKGGFGGAPASHILSQVPGIGTSPGQVQMAGALEAQNVVPNTSGAN